MNDSDDFTAFWGEPIHVYTRAQAIDDGMLCEVSEMAREYGLVWPVAMTRTVWADCVEWTDEDNARKGTGQDERGRLRDVCAMAAMRMRAAAARDESGSNVRLAFNVLRTPRDGRGAKARVCPLVLHVGPGDAGEPVLTIMLPNED